MTDREVMQQALEALEEIIWSKDSFLQLDAITALRTALEQQAKPVSHAVIVGALFDFIGWLTTRKKRLILSSTDNASPAADAIKVFAEMRGLSLDDALVQDWQNYTTPLQQQAELVGEVIDERGEVDYISYVPPVGTALYTTPPQRQWVGLTDEDFCDQDHEWIAGASWAEAKLKERNT